MNWGKSTLEMSATRTKMISLSALFVRVITHIHQKYQTYVDDGCRVFLIHASYV